MFWKYVAICIEYGISIIDITRIKVCFEFLIFLLFGFEEKKIFSYAVST